MFLTSLTLPRDKFELSKIGPHFWRRLSDSALLGPGAANVLANLGGLSLG